MSGRILLWITACGAIVVGGCYSAAPMPEGGARSDSSGPQQSLKADALRLSDTGSFYLRFSVSVDDFHKEPVQGTYEYRKRSGVLNDLQSNVSPRISGSTIVAGGGANSNQGYRAVLRVQLVSFDHLKANFSIDGDFAFRQTGTEGDGRRGGSAVWGAKLAFPPRTVAVNWGQTRSVAFDISDIDGFAPFRDELGAEIVVMIANPVWSSSPWQEAAAAVTESR